MEDSSLTIKIDGCVAWLTMNRPEVMNSLTREMLEGIRVGLEVARTDAAVRVVVVNGYGTAFCAGADLKGLRQEDGSVDPVHFMDFVKYTSDTFERIPRLSKPVIAAVNGYALAGGLELALACDLVIASKSARLGDAHVNYGLIPGGGGTARLPRVVSPVVARFLAFTGDNLPASELVPLGLVNEVVDDDHLEARVSELARQIAEKSPPGLARMKRLLHDGLEQPLATALRMEQDALFEHLQSADVVEGLVAFRERRKPHFTDGGC